MSARKTLKVHLGLFISYILLFICVSADAATYLTNENIAKQLDWVIDDTNECGGYYLESAITTLPDKNDLEIISKEGLIAQRSTSTLEGNVTLTKDNQRITTNKMYIYRHPDTFDFSVAEMIGDVHYREPNTLIIGKKGRYNFDTHAKSLMDILYRTTFNGKNLRGPHIAVEQIHIPHKITGLTAWGEAESFSQTIPQVYELNKVTYSTCAPNNPAWQLAASHLTLDKNKGRGSATHARLFIKQIPVFYVPYLNFPLDDRRQSGFLWPTLGVNNKYGPYFFAPFYWNIAPNSDMTVTPGLLTKRGLQLSDQFRYLTDKNRGIIHLTLLPNDQFFKNFKASQSEKYATSTDPVTQAELSRLNNSSTTRNAFSWRDEAYFNEHWSSHVDFNYVSDDYYLSDFGNNLHEVNADLILEEAELNYKARHWNFTGKLQAYQTLHPLDEAPVKNVYKRLPQIILEANYPHHLYGLEYFIKNEVTHFEILKDPGSNISSPIGNRYHVQPGVSLPLYTPYLYANPRLQLALTHYDLYQIKDTNAPSNINRAIPIFDVVTGLAFSRDVTVFNHAFQQTLEPQLYYTYIPYHNQSRLPVFDTTVNTLYYDQLFNYNRFSGLDRINDANQVGIGVTTRLIDQTTGLEKLRLGIGNIVYFTKRTVTLCNDLSCSDNPTNPSNHWRLSPVSGVLDYHINDIWTLSTNTIWNPISKQLDNTTINIHYQPKSNQLINIGYSFARGGDVLSGVQTSNPQNNLKVTNFSFTSPITHDINMIGLWSQNWNHRHLQNLLYGLQYDTCCWAVRLVGGRTFSGVDPKNNFNPQYNSEYFIQFSLKGLGNIGKDASSILNSIAGYNTQFGQVF